MGSRDGDSFAGGGGSRSSGKYNNSPFVDNFGGYTWDGEGEWIYDGCNGKYPPSRYDAITPSHLPFNGRKPFSDSSGTHFTPDQKMDMFTLPMSMDVIAPTAQRHQPNIGAVDCLQEN